jgi:ferredoxin--NADP+ reductase
MQNAPSPETIAELSKQEYNATVTYFRRIHDELAVIRVRPDFPIPQHKAGQYTTIGAGYWEPRVEGCQPEHLDPGQPIKVVKRAYSISSSVLHDDGHLLRPEEEDHLEFYIVLVRDAEKRPPALTPRLFAMQQGSRLFVSPKITGGYVLDPVRPDDTVLFMATGTGEAPHNKMLLELLRRGHGGMMASIVCVRLRGDLGYFDVHEKLVARYPNYRYIWLTTREKENLQNKLYIQDLIRGGELEKRIGQAVDPQHTHVFLCGNPKMIGLAEKGPDGKLHYPQPTGVVELLEQRGFKCDRPHEPANIHFEKYW